MQKTRKEISRESILLQTNICNKLAMHFCAGGKKPLALVDTYGCQQNVSDSECLRGYLSEMGFEFTQDEFKADVIVINTCAIREHAEMRVLGNVGNLNHTKKANPNQIIALCGCMVQQENMSKKIKKSYTAVDFVFGPHDLWRFPELLQRNIQEKCRIFEYTDCESVIAEAVPRVRDGYPKAWVSVMYGCNNFCSYCVVPFVRGRERSRRPEEIVAETKDLVAQGYKDITLLGQNVNSYGKDLDCGIDFSDLLCLINDIPGDFVIRFMTSHPKDAGEKLFRTMAKCEKCARHLHLPAQSGSSRVLAAMNRGYTRGEYLEKINLARSLMPGLVVTTDIIVGFPGETDEEFEETLSLVEQAQYDAMFTFIFSPREGTKAAKMPDDATRQDKQRRFDALIEVSNRISLKKHQDYIGQALRVLVDGEREKGSIDEYTLSGRTNGGRLVHLKGDKELIGSFTQVKIVSCSTWALFGETDI